MEQPVFIVEDVATQFAMQSGTTVLVAVFDAISDQAKQEKVSENIILVLMTTCVVPVN